MTALVNRCTGNRDGTAKIQRRARSLFLILNAFPATARPDASSSMWTVVAAARPDSSPELLVSVRGAKPVAVRLEESGVPIEPPASEPFQGVFRDVGRGVLGGGIHRAWREAERITGEPPATDVEREASVRSA